MKKIMMFAFAALVCASVAMAQTYTLGTGIQGIDKLGAHQNGGRGCVGCHTPHSGARGNGGTLQWDAASGTFKPACPPLVILAMRPCGDRTSGR